MCLFHSGLLAVFVVCSTSERKPSQSFLGGLGELPFFFPFCVCVYVRPKVNIVLRSYSPHFLRQELAEPGAHRFGYMVSQQASGRLMLAQQVPYQVSHFLGLQRPYFSNYASL